MKKAIFLLLIMTIFSNAKMINSVAMSVNGLAITTAEIKAVSKQYRVSKDKAVDMLVMDRVQQSAMKDIPVTNAEVQERLSLIAKQNNITLSKMKSVLKSQGVRWSKYQDKIRNVIKKDKFFRMKIAQDITPPSKTELKKLYDKTKKTLFIPSSISVVEYKSKNQKSLQEAIKAKKIKGKWKRLYTKDLEPSMLNILMRTPNGGYTQPMNAGGEYIAYKVVSKSGKRAMSFELAQPILSRMYQREQQDKLLKEYFAKEKLKAKIKKLR